MKLAGISDPNATGLVGHPTTTENLVSNAVTVTPITREHDELPRPLSHTIASPILGLSPTSLMKEVPKLQLIDPIEYRHRRLVPPEFSKRSRLSDVLSERHQQIREDLFGEAGVVNGDDWTPPAPSVPAHPAPTEPGRREEAPAMESI